eukprot:1083435-Pelagomonas_calceolata.AAC.3
MSMHASTVRRTLTGSRASSTAPWSCHGRRIQSQMFSLCTKHLYSALCADGLYQGQLHGTMVLPWKAHTKSNVFLVHKAHLHSVLRADGLYQGQLHGTIVTMAIARSNTRAQVFTS